MGRIVLLYAATAIAMVALDLVWLAVVARRFYVDQLGDMLAPRPDIGIALLFYVVYAVGLVWFVAWPADRGGGVGPALLQGALFGFFAYATYDLTNLSTLRQFPAVLAITDMAWGTAVSAVAAGIGVLVTRWLAGTPA
jgi:uncharacterized membrane protein